VEAWHWDEVVDTAAFENQELAALLEPVRHAVARLPDEERHVIEWFFWEAEPLPAIARRLGRRHPQKVWLIKQRALARLRKWLVK
jgi:DNA-directed RNA polymerase specialized sigma24 family protein